MYDTFEPFEKIKPFEFNFTTKSYKIWVNGQVIKERNIFNNILFSPNFVDNNKIVVKFENEIDSIHKKLNFDSFITSNDRLQMLIIPAETNNNNPGIDIFRNFLGPTRNQFDFDNKTPYCCNLFLIQNKIVKITFSFSNPLMLIEFD